MPPNSASLPGPRRHSRWVDYALLVRLHKPIGTLLLLWPTLWALWMAADGAPEPYLLFAFCLGTLLMRSAGCAINDYADRDFDRHVARTRERPLTAGRIQAWEALMVAVGLALLAGLLVLPMNRLTLALAVVAVFVAATYPYMKRFFAMPQAYLGIAFGFGIPMGFAAVLGEVPASGWLMLLANVSWALAYDTEYAMVDRDDDLKIGIRTAAVTLGRHDVAAIMTFYGITIALLAWVGHLEGLGAWYYAGLAVAALISAWHYTMIRTRTREGCFRAFNHNTWWGAAVMAGLLLDLGV